MLVIFRIRELVTWQRHWRHLVPKGCMIKISKNTSMQLLLMFYSLKRKSRMQACENLHLAFSFTATSTGKVRLLIPPYSCYNFINNFIYVPLCNSVSVQTIT